MDIHSELDRGRLNLSVVIGARECGRPFVMNDCFIHTAGELPSSPASFHDIYALQRSVRHGTCFRRRLATHHAGAAPHSAVAELGVVGRSVVR